MMDFMDPQNSFENVEWKGNLQEMSRQLEREFILVCINSNKNVDDDIVVSTKILRTD